MRYSNLLCRVAGAIAAVALGTAGCGTRQPAATSAAPVAVRPVAPAGPPGAWQAATGLVNLEPGPVIQYEQACASCHGRAGSKFGWKFARMGANRLDQETAKMMVGLGRLHPSAGQTEGMTAYMHALQKGRPFVVVNNAAAFAGGQQAYLRGEATPGTTVEIHKGGQVVPVTVQGLAWSVTKPPSPPFSIVGTRGRKRVEFAFPLQQWSETAGRTVPADTRNIPAPSGNP